MDAQTRLLSLLAGATLVGGWASPSAAAVGRARDVAAGSSLTSAAVPDLAPRASGALDASAVPIPAANAEAPSAVDAADRAVAVGESRDAQLEIDGEIVRFRHHAGRKGAPVLMVLPGQVDWPELWDNATRSYREAGYTVVVPDTQFPTGHRQQAAQIAGLIERLNLRRVTLVGHSRGALNAIDVAADPGISKRILKLYLVAPYLKRLDFHYAEKAGDKAYDTGVAQGGWMGAMMGMWAGPLGMYWGGWWGAMMARGYGNANLARWRKMSDREKDELLRENGMAKRLKEMLVEHMVRRKGRSPLTSEDRRRVEAAVDSSFDIRWRDLTKEPPRLADHIEVIVAEPRKDVTPHEWYEGFVGAVRSLHGKIIGPIVRYAGEHHTLWLPPLD